MVSFNKTIYGINFSFHHRYEKSGYYYKVSSEYDSFELKLDQYGIWRIQGEVPFEIKRLEYKFDKAIFDAINRF
jgi:hypothetical protein